MSTIWVLFLFIEDNGTSAHIVKTHAAPSSWPLSDPSDKFVQILTGWYLNIGKPLPSVAAIQSAIRSEPTFIRNFRYRFHLSASTSNKSPDRFRGIARLTKNNREQTALWTNRGSTSTINFNMNYCFVNNNVCFGWHILRSVKIVLHYFSYATILKLWLKEYYLFWRRVDIKIENRHGNKYV